MPKLNIIIASTPPMIPNDSQAAWVNGYSKASKAGEKIINDMFSYLDSTAKARIIAKHKEYLEGSFEEVEPFKAKNRQLHNTPKPHNIMPCGHPKKYIIETFETNENLCTLCGLRKGK